jgi:hypothetical protein
MDNKIYLNTELYILEENIRKTANDLDICAEIFVAQSASTYYSNIMTMSNPDLASKSTLLGWLNDYNRKATSKTASISRPGLISL